MADISSCTLAKFGKDKYVSLESIEKICCALRCNIDHFTHDEGINGKC